MRILFCGDLVLKDTSNYEISDSVKNYFNSFDYKIVNFEGPINDPTTKEIKLIKAGPHVCNSEKTLELIKTLGINVAALSNNHIMDYGENALSYTLEQLKNNQVLSLGAGLLENQDLKKIYEPLIIQDQNEKIALFNICQAEFGVVKNDSVKAGYTWINHPLVNQLIQKYKESEYKIIIFAHAGVENEEYVLPEWRQRYHEFIEFGADYVIATHPHIIQGIELYKNKTIAYSLGNFFFPSENNGDNWTRGLVAALDTNKLSVEFKTISFTNNKLVFYENKDYEEILKKRSYLVSDDKVVDEFADELSERTWNMYYKSYYENIIPHNLKQIIKKIIKNIFHQKNYSFDETMLLHNIQIESHRWCVERYLYNKNCKDNNLK